MTCRSVINTPTEVVREIPTFYSSFTSKVIKISYGENTTSGPRGSIVQEFFRVKMSGYVVHTYGPSGKYQNLHVCLKAASV